MPIDPFELEPTRLHSPCDTHALIVPSDTIDLNPKPRSIYCQVAGNVMIRDKNDVDLSYAVVVGQILPFRGKRVMLTGTTATVYAWG